MQDELKLGPNKDVPVSEILNCFLESAPYSIVDQVTAAPDEKYFIFKNASGDFFLLTETDFFFGDIIEHPLGDEDFFNTYRVSEAIDNSGYDWLPVNSVNVPSAGSHDPNLDLIEIDQFRVAPLDDNPAIYNDDGNALAIGTYIYAVVPVTIRSSDSIKQKGEIKAAIAYIKKFFAGDASGHDYWHTIRVYHNAKAICKNENCDTELVYLAALLHDVDDYKLVGEEQTHNAVDFLRSINFPEERIGKIIHIITQVSFKGADTVTPDTIEGKVVQDADRLDAIGAIGIARAFAYGGNKNRVMHDPNEEPHLDLSAEEYKKYEGTSINHFYEKLLLLKDLMNTDTAKEIAEGRHQYMEQFLDEFYDEWEGTK